mmetsp:Transcript_6542/g.18083  ORF Transcript_6542/g.18083 Transcript_6542/m.18083 type:complete len:208 (-) Transcript_6542:640-1263(-)
MNQRVVHVCIYLSIDSSSKRSPRSLCSLCSPRSPRYSGLGSTSPTTASLLSSASASALTPYASLVGTCLTPIATFVGSWFNRRAIVAMSSVLVGMLSRRLISASVSESPDMTPPVILSACMASRSSFGSSSFVSFTNFRYALMDSAICSSWMNSQTLSPLAAGLRFSHPSTWSAAFFISVFLHTINVAPSAGRLRRNCCICLTVNPW